MTWLETIRQKFTKELERPVADNIIDRAIIERLPQDGEVSKVYEARWVWYHTILAVEIFFTNIILLGILIVIAIKL